MFSFFSKKETIEDWLAKQTLKQLKNPPKYVKLDDFEGNPADLCFGELKRRDLHDLGYAAIFRPLSIRGVEFNDDNTVTVTFCDGATRILPQSPTFGSKELIKKHQAKYDLENYTEIRKVWALFE